MPCSIHRIAHYLAYLLGVVQFGIVVLCTSAAMEQGLLFWEKLNFSAARLQLINMWTFSVRQEYPETHRASESSYKARIVIFFFSLWEGVVCVLNCMCVFSNVCKYFLNLKNALGSMFLHRPRDRSAGELSATLTSWGLWWLHVVQTCHMDLKRPEGLITFAALIEALAPVSSLDR